MGISFASSTSTSTSTRKPIFGGVPVYLYSGRDPLILTGIGFLITLLIGVILVPMLAPQIGFVLAYFIITLAPLVITFLIDITMIIILRSSGEHLYRYAMEHQDFAILLTLVRAVILPQVIYCILWHFIMTYPY